MELEKIDGSYGEGGGQIVRSAVTLSCITGKPVEVENIRKNRRVQGLRPQHLVGIKLLAKICDAKVDGLHVGSTSIRFHPSSVIDSELKEDIKTAGSIPLILQLLIPAVSLSKKNLKLSITGGTDVPWSPTSNYVKFVITEAFSRIGIEFSMDIRKRGYYPKGGGHVNVQVYPCEKIESLQLTKRTSKAARLVCSYYRISKSLIEEQVLQTQSILKKNGFSSNYEIIEEAALNEGCSLLAFNHGTSWITGYDTICTKGNHQLAEIVSKNFIENDLGVDNFLSDMLVIPLSLAEQMSIFTVKKITKHLETSLFVTSKMVGCKYGIGKLDDGYEVRIVGNSDARV
ncbi:MAG: RNA 3'-terminal phosphate cyclase [Nitrosopumilaceae archaeon]